MPESFAIQIIENKVPVFAEEFFGPVELGRQRVGEDRPYSRVATANGTRIVVAEFVEDTVSRQHVRVEPNGNNQVTVANLSTVRSIVFADLRELKPNQVNAFFLPAVFSLGNKTIFIQPVNIEKEPDGMQSLSEKASIPTDSSSTTFTPFPPIAPKGVSDADLESLIRWMQTTMGVLESASTSTDFFQRAAQALVEIVNLDMGSVLVRRNGKWHNETTKTLRSEKSPDEWKPSTHILNKLMETRTTIWQTPSESSSSGVSLMGLAAVVAAPILDRNGEVIGALYGDRRLTKGGEIFPNISKLEAMLVEFLASSVGVGLARVAQEKAIVQARVQFEQFFTPKLAQQITTQPDLLAGRDCDVSILFVDVRGFSRISERLGPARTVDWMNDVLGILSDCVLEEEGVLVDYIGDELIGMWGAPELTTDHAARACKAGLKMLTKLAEIDERWLPVLGEKLRLGIGINTGLARVGNTGSQRKFKYGPLGNTVNLASRVQGATKYLRTPFLITNTTLSQLPAGFAVRRVAKVRVVNISASLDLFEMSEADSKSHQDLKQEFELALEQFESGNFRETVRILGVILSKNPDDGPSLVLLSRSVEHIVNTKIAFDPIWDLPGK